MEAEEGGAAPAASPQRLIADLLALARHGWRGGEGEDEGEDAPSTSGRCDDDERERPRRPPPQVIL